MQNRWSMVLLCAALCGGCSGDEESPPAAATASAPATTPVAAAAQTSKAGSMTFTYAGEQKRFDYLPDGNNFYTQLGSALAAKPAADATETLTITFLSMNLAELDYPAELPLPRDATRPMTALSAMANVGFSYVDEDGSEWAGPGRVRLDAFESGRIAGSFAGVSLPHTEKLQPNIELQNGRFQAQLD